MKYEYSVSGQLWVARTNPAKATVPTALKLVHKIGHLGP